MGAARVVSTIAAMAAAFMPLHAAGQALRTPVEAGASVSAVRIDPGSDGVSAAVGTWLDLPLSRRVAIEFRAELVPSDRPALLQFTDGSTLTLAAGFRGKFISRPRYALIGTLSPEVVRVTNTVTGVEQDEFVLGTGTYFSLASSVGLEIYPSDRWLVRVDAASSTFFASGFELARSEGPEGVTLVASQPTRRLLTLQLRAGIGLRLGTPVDDGPETPVDGRWDVGAHLGHASTIFLLDAPMEPIRDASLGGFGSYKLTNYVYADGAFSFFFDDRRVFTPYTGGRRLHVLGGVKVGPRFDRYGVFAKIRAGVHSSSSVLKTILASETPRVLGRANYFAMEVGGVLERDLRRNWFVRLDASVLSTFYRSLSFTFEGQPGTISAPDQNESLEMSVGVGWRFK